MNPPKKAAVIDFMEWCRRNTPVMSFSSLERAEFMLLVEKYELSKGVKVIKDEQSNLRRKWQVAYDNYFRSSDNDQEALNKYPNF